MTQRMTESRSLAEDLSLLTDRELAAVLSSAREIRSADPKNIEADWAVAFQFTACPFCGTLTDPLNFDYRLFFALITDAFRSGANAISVRCGESGVIVSYDNSPKTQLREVMPSRHWHQILAGVHTVFARHAMDEQIHAALDQNFLALTESFPDFDALRRAARNSGRAVPSGLRIEYTDSLLIIRFES